MHDSCYDAVVTVKNTYVSHSPLCILLLWITGSLYAQSATANLAGTVQDEQDASVRGAKITLRDPAKGISRETLTDATGTFRFARLLPGGYELTAESSGFATARVEGLALNANDQRSLLLEVKGGPEGKDKHECGGMSIP